MTHPDIISILLSCFVFVAFFAFIGTHMLLASKRILTWWEGIQNRRHPPSVQLTMNQMNIGSNDPICTLSDEELADLRRKHGRTH